MDFKAYTNEQLQILVDSCNRRIILAQSRMDAVNAEKKLWTDEQKRRNGTINNVVVNNK
jgi:hypothetical protein